MTSPGAQERAERLVLAWLQADYEPDELDGRWMSDRALEALVVRLTELFDRQALPPPFVSPSSAAGRLIAAGDIRPGTPQECSPDVAGEPGLRSPECAAYTRCAEVVRGRGWTAWSCRACDGPGVQAMRLKAQGSQLVAGEGGGDAKATGVQCSPDGTPWG